MLFAGYKYRSNDEDNSVVIQGKKNKNREDVESCGSDSKCASGRCQDHVCTALGSNGDTCDQNKDCESTLCKYGICKEILSDSDKKIANHEDYSRPSGAPCGSDKRCAGQSCVDGFCAKRNFN